MRCARCGRTTRHDGGPCDACGAPRAEPVAADAGERKTVTALFADIKGSMELIDELDPEDARGIVDPALEVMTEAVRRYDGWLAHAGGDGVFALFGVPAACEDHPQRALHAALRMQEGVGRFAERLRRERGLGLSIRVGVNTGEVIVRPARAEGAGDLDPLGHPIGVAKRLEALALPGSILVSDRTQALADGFFAFRPLGPARLRGVARPVGLFELLGPGPARTRFDRSAWRGLTRLVGRQGELAALRAALDDAGAGRGRIVALVGEAGVGKSRLVHELTAAVRSSWLVLEACATAHGTSQPFRALVDLLERHCAVAPHDDAAVRREKVAARVLGLDAGLEDVLPYLFALLEIVGAADPLAHMNAGIRRARTVDAVTRVLLRHARDRPLLVVLEDAHWLDADTEAFLAAFADAIPTARVACLVTHRPEHDRRWAGSCATTALRLDRLGAADAERLVESLVGREEALAPLRDAILARADGNPFFIEEIVQALRERGVVDDGAPIGPVRPPAEFSIPPTVQALLASRVDDLPADARGLLQTLAVIGRECPAALVREVAGLPDAALGRLVGVLRAAEFVHERPAAEATHRFKHALTQEVVYGTILRDRRRLLHRRVAEAIERVHGARPEDHLAALAHHYRLAGDVVRAAEWLCRAGEQAARRSANTEAERQLRAALDLLAGAPDGPDRAAQELRLQTALGTVLLAAHGYGAPAVLEAFTRAGELADGAADPALRVAALRGLSAALLQQARLGTARELAWQLRSEAQRSHAPGLLLEAERLLCEIYYWQGQLAPSRAHALRVQALHRPSEDGVHVAHGEHPVVVASGLLAWTLWASGRADEARAQAAQAAALAGRVAHPFTTAFALGLCAALHCLCGDADAAEAEANALADAAAVHGFPEWAAWAAACRGAALVHRGMLDDGIALMRDGLAAAREAGGEIVFTLLTAWIADACVRAGRPDAALAAAADGLAAVRRTGARAWYPELLRCHAEALVLRDGAGAAVDDVLHRARYVAGHQGARALELRVATTQARLARRRGALDAARGLVTPCEAVAAGGETADVAAARAALAAAARGGADGG